MNQRVSIQVKLNKAVECENLERIDRLLLSGADPNWCDSNHPFAPMHIATWNGYLPGLERLLVAGANLDCEDFTGKTPLAVAASEGEVEAGRWLLQHGANVHFIVRKPFKKTVLYEAIAGQHLDFATMLLKENPCSRELDLPTSTSKLPDLVFDLRTLSWLLNEGVTPDLVMESSGQPWLIHMQYQTARNAFVHQHVDMLLAAGVNVNLQDSRGKTALLEAANNRNAIVFAKLLRAGGDPDIPCEAGVTARKLVTYMEASEMLEDLKFWGLLVRLKKLFRKQGHPAEFGHFNIDDQIYCICRAVAGEIAK